MNNTNSWATYVIAVQGDDNNADTARKVGVSEATVGRWVRGIVDPKPRQVVELARAYQQNPLAALIAVGYLTEIEAGLPIGMPRRMQLSQFDDLELAKELVRRIEDGADHPELDGQLGDVVSGSGEDYDYSDNAPSQNDVALVAKTGRKKADQPHAD